MSSSSGSETNSPEQSSYEENNDIPVNNENDQNSPAQIENPIENSIQNQPPPTLSVNNENESNNQTTRVPKFITNDNFSIDIVSKRTNNRRNTMNPRNISQLTPGSDFLRSQMSTSSIMTLEDQLSRKEIDDGPISSVYSKRKRSVSFGANVMENRLELNVNDSSNYFKYEPENDYEVNFDNGQFIMQDSDISQFIKNHSYLDNYSWNQYMIKNANLQENPFYSPYSEYLKSKDQKNSNTNFQDSVPVQIFSEKVRKIEMYDLNYPDRPEATLTPTISFIGDKDQSNSGELSEKPSVFRSYSIDQPPLAPRFSLNAVSADQLVIDKAAYMGVTLQEFSMIPGQIEPLFFTAYIYSTKKFVSEEWHFAPDSTDRFNNGSPNPLRIALNKQGAFELPDDFDSPVRVRSFFLVIAVSHPLTIDGNAPVNKFYMKGAGFETNAKLNINKTFPDKNKDVMTTFAYTFVNLADLLRDAQNVPETDEKKIKFTFKNFYDASGQFSAQKIKDTLQDSIKKRPKEGDYKMEMSVDIDFKRVVHPSVEFPGFDLLNLTENQAPKEPKPSIRLAHKLALHIDHVNFKTPKGVKARNIYGEISMKTDENLDGIESLHSHLNPQNLETIGKTRCFYHENKGVFDQVFVFDLPYPVPEKLFINIDFFHLVLKKSDQDKSWIGQVSIPIFESENKFIQNGPHLFTVHYNRGERGNDPKIDTGNAISFSTLITSALVPSDSNLYAFYKSKGKDTNALKETKKEFLIENFYVIVEMLVELMKTDPEVACQNLNQLYLMLKDELKQKINEYLQIYAQVLSLRNPSADYHKKMFIGMANSPNMSPGLYHFMFMLIIKSIFLTRDNSFCESFKMFIEKVPKTISEKPTRETITEYAKFVNLLMDIGCYSASIESATAMIHFLKEKPEITLFLYEVFHPKFLYLSVMTSDKMIKALIELFKYARCYSDNIFQKMVFVLETLPEEIKDDLDSRLLDTLLAISPLEKVRFANKSMNGRVQPIIIYFAFVLEYMKQGDPILENWLKNMKNPEEFSESIHFIIENIKITESSLPTTREVTFAIQFAIINAMTLMININEQMRELGFLTYHLLCTNLAKQFIPLLIQILIEIAKKDISFLFRYFVPPLPKILVHLFKITRSEPSSLIQFINTIFEKDREQYHDTRRSLALITRSIYKLNENELKITLENLKQGLPEDERLKIAGNASYSYDSEFFNRGNLKFLCNFVYDYYSSIRYLQANELDFDVKTEIYWKMIEMFQYSPDVTIEILVEFSKANEENDYLDEAVQCKLLIAAIILEHLTLQNKIKPLFYELHAAHAFDTICSMSSFAIYKDDNCPDIIGFCDSPKFNLTSLISLLMNITKMTFNNNSQMQIYELAVNLIGLVWPILESQKSFYYIERFFKLESLVQQQLLMLPPDEDRLFGHYFRVSFYGESFCELNGKTYIYHEKMLTHLFELSERLTKAYKNKFPTINIQLIKESGDVDVSQLDLKTNGYIQITFVEPYFPKEEQLLRGTSYDKAHMIRTFMFDTPFTKLNKAQGSIEHQWLRRTLLTVKNRMPSIMKFEEVVETVNKNFEPIRVSYRQLHERCTMIQTAIAQNDIRNIQQLLHGSLLVMVNEGPSRMAEVFLGGDQNDQDQIECDPQKMNKYKDKLRKAFKLFLNVNKEALKIHANYAAKDPTFIPLQNELEAGFYSLRDKLTQYINI